MHKVTKKTAIDLVAGNSQSVRQHSESAIYDVHSVCEILRIRQKTLSARSEQVENSLRSRPYVGIEGRGKEKTANEEERKKKKKIPAAPERSMSVEFTEIRH